jgi:hypothetical protein
MFVTRAFFDPGLVLLASLGVLSTLWIALTVPRPHVLRRTGLADEVAIGVMLILSAAVAYAVTREAAGTLLATVVAAAGFGATGALLPRLSAAGVVQTALPVLALVAWPWSFLLAWEQGFPAWALALTAVGAGLSLAPLAFTFATRLVDNAVYTHAQWRRPVRAPQPARRGHLPKVSVHVPCYAEPPEVVIATLERLAAQRYSNFEVHVCDNNTPDEALWRPLERWCAHANRRPGPRFHFHHVSPLAGAKAGALNYLLKHTAADAELVAVVDADYLAEPDFLPRMTGFFADPKVGFVQSPHDYRPDGSLYQQLCYWEYMPPNRVGLASINEYDCAYTIGTMCILRKDAILAAGGWAEWCLTEDSEISIRIRALGYEGVYTNETFGRGLIPETYQDYKKQRFRWTGGPVQQLLAHWRLFLPTALGGSPNMHGWVKLMEVNRSVAPILSTLGFVSSLALAAAVSWLTVSGRLPALDLPHAFWVAAMLGSAMGVARLWLQYRLTGCASIAEMVGAEAARLSLSWIKVVAAATALTGRPIKWWRTPKFAVGGSAARALVSTLPELTLGAVVAAVLAILLRNADELGGDVTGVGLAACASALVMFASAPAMALLSELRLRRAAVEPEGEVEEAEIPEAA